MKMYGGTSRRPLQQKRTLGEHKGRACRECDVQEKRSAVFGENLLQNCITHWLSKPRAVAEL